MCNIIYNGYLRPYEVKKNGLNLKKSAISRMNGSGDIESNCPILMTSEYTDSMSKNDDYCNEDIDGHSNNNLQTCYSLHGEKMIEDFEIFSCETIDISLTPEVHSTSISISHKGKEEKRKKYELLHPIGGYSVGEKDQSQQILLFTKV